MEDKFYKSKYYRFKRNGKDCYVWFHIADYWGDIEFTSTVHKVSLNVYRFVKIKDYLRDNHLYI